MNCSEIVVVTGASAGVGRATIIEFAKRKRARVALLARGLKGLEGAARDVEAHGGEALIIQVDVADAEQLQRAAQKVVDTWGGIDIWVNCAMVTILSPFSEITPEEFRRATEVTYLGYVYGTHAALKQMLPLNRGTIVQVGSALSYRGIPLQSAYCGAKHAIKGFTESLICELMHNKSKVRVNMVQLPAINTPQFEWSRNKMERKHQPVPPIYEPQLSAEAIFWSAHSKRREIQLGTSAMVIWLGKLFPKVVDIYLAKTGFDAQQYNGAVAKDKPDNLFAPVEGDYGARGQFSHQAQSKSIQLKITTFPGYPFILYAGVGLSLMLLKKAGKSFYRLGDLKRKKR
ncbi:short-chain alcohol dehydrogenase [Chitinispirillum alkaliphilum]|nr:short-chain alcohol dehydrogenase [Chitinispirillum alkaliphilum]